MDEILKLMRVFPMSVITSSSEVVLDRKGNVSFTVHSGMTREEIIAKIMEWCSRSCAKAEPYAYEKRNSEWRDSLILKFNRYLGTTFNQADFYLIYDQLGNAVNHDLTLRFIESGLDLNLLIEAREKERRR